MKGIILAGGAGSRLHPITIGVSKQLLPVYDKPMIYYPLSALMLAGIRDVLIITTPEDVSGFQRLLGNGENLGIRLSYAEQPYPRGLAEAFLIGEDFIGEDSVCLVLGDNLFYGDALGGILQSASKVLEGAIVFGAQVTNPKDYGILELDIAGRPISIEEKPKTPKSQYAVPGLYFYDNSVVEKAKSIGPSNRGELEITDVNQLYLDQGSLKVELFGRGIAWFDTGNPDSLLDAGNFVATIERRQGLKIGCIEEISLRNGWINGRQLGEIINGMADNSYRQYLSQILNINDAAMIS